MGREKQPTALKLAPQQRKGPSPAAFIAGGLCGLVCGHTLPWQGRIKQWRRWWTSRGTPGEFLGTGDTWKGAGGGISSCSDHQARSLLQHGHLSWARPWLWLLLQ